MSSDDGDEDLPPLVPASPGASAPPTPPPPKPPATPYRKRLVRNGCFVADGSPARKKPVLAEEKQDNVEKKKDEGDDVD